jgi:hypothetical protein
MSISWLMRTLLFVSIGLGAATMLLWAVPGDLGVTPDSTVYLATANSIIDGIGFVDRGHAMTQYPPGYVLLLGAGGYINEGDVLGAARWIHAMLFSLNILLAGALAMRVTNGSFVATAATMGFLLLSPMMISVHAMLWSEPLFITLTLGALLFLVHGLTDQSRRLVLLSASLFALALATRFAGVVLLIVPILGIGLFWRNDSPERWRLIGEVSVLFFSPILLWLARGSSGSTAPGYWTLSFHPPGFGHLRMLVNTVHDFFIIAGVGDFSRAVHLTALAIMMSLAFRELYRGKFFAAWPPSRAAVFQALWILMAVFYLAFILLTIAFISAETPLDGRILLPVLVPVLIGLVGLSHAVSLQMGNRAIRYASYLALFFLASVNANRAWAEAVDIRTRGRGFTSTEWRSSQTMAEVARVGPRYAIYTNAPDAVWLATSRAAWPLPKEANPDTRKANVRYSDEIDGLCKEVTSGRAVVAYFDAVGWAWFYPTTTEFEARCRRGPTSSLADGDIYRTESR